MQFGRGDYLNMLFINNEGPSIEEQRIKLFCKSPLYNTSIVAFNKLTKGDTVKTVYDVTLNIKNCNENFQPGDAIGILPCNNENEVNELLERLKFLQVSKKGYYLKPIVAKRKKPEHIPERGTLQELFMKYIDIRKPPTKAFLAMMAQYTTQEDELNELKHLYSGQGSKDYRAFVEKNNSLLKVFLSFPSCYPPVEKLLDYVPSLRPRFYSIISSPLSSPDEIHIAFVVVGVCTNWLENEIKKLETNEEDVIEKFQNLSINNSYIPFYFLQSSGFCLPENPSIPIIMIAAGTGIAPFIGFMQHRHLLNENLKSAWLFYGCRYSDQDFLYKSEIESYLQNGTLTELFTCFSREGDKKEYVQDLIKLHAKRLVKKLLDENAVIYVCGDAKNMTKDVRNTIGSCLEETTGWSKYELDDYLNKTRYKQDSWI